MKIIKNIFSKFLVTVVLMVLVFGGVVMPVKVNAQLVVNDPGSIGATLWGWTVDFIWWANDHAEKIWEAAKEKVSVETYHTVLSNALNKMAFETATWLGSGDDGKKPMFLTESKGDYFKNMADNAAGTYIEEISKGAFKDTFNLCEPDLNVKVMIGLGLAKPKLEESSCSFTKMRDNWEKEVLQNKEFLSDINNYFETGGDLGVALTMNEQQAEIVKLTENEATLNLLVDRGWNPVKEKISNKVVSPPDTAADKVKKMRDTVYGRTLITTSDAFVDAAKVFANQYFITLFERKMAELGKDKKSTSSPYDNNKAVKSLQGLIDPDYEGGTNNSEDISQSLLELVQPNFEVSSDFEVLAKLAVCPDPINAGPTDCVMDFNFLSAVNENLTVGQAMNKGYLRQNGKFGFLVEYVDDRYQCFGDEPSYNEGYPYRSMLILRKYRILPVGWELAAQYIHDRAEVTNTCTLGDMVACFDTSDEYTYTSGSCNQGSWCRGLVDPNWVLTAPEHTCKRSGPGPDIVSYQATKGATEFDSQLVIKRNEYCADEQSCIAEKDDGVCEVYGYCVEEKRKWDFGTDSCDPNYNSCETFRDSSGKSLSLLENTIDNSVCTADNVGCTSYCEDYSLDTSAIPMFTLEQNGSTHNLPATFASAETASAFYNYTASSFNQPLLNPIIGEDKSVIFMHYDTVNEVFSLGMFHDYPNVLLYPGCESLASCPSLGGDCDCDGGTASFTFTDISSGNRLAVADEPGEIPAVGTEIMPGTVFNWAYSPCCTDGGMIDMPTGNWSVTIDPNSFTGLNRWVLAYDGGEIPLDMSEPVTISKNVMTGNFSCLAGGGDEVYLDKDAKACDEESEGCHQFIRTKTGLGTNLIQNSGFEDYTIGTYLSVAPGDSELLGVSGWPVENNSASVNTEVTVFGTSGGQIHSGERSLFVQADGTLPYLPQGINGSGLYSFDSSTTGDSVLVDNFKMKLDHTYSLSAWVFVEAGGVDLAIGNNATHWEKASSSAVAIGSWQNISLNVINNGSLNANEILIYSNQPGSRFYVDDIQLEESLSTSNYKAYGEVNVVYEKILPDYLADSCYRNPGVDYGYKDDYSSVCDNYARLCNEEEVGCDMYSSVNSGISIPAKVDVMDYCTAECIGYDQYMQHETIFSSLEPKYFIPANSSACDAGSVACEEFTNLDAVVSGGETKEYYSYLRQCVKPGEVGSNCNEFYTWEGSSETGFQLKVHSLQTDNDGDDGALIPEARYDDDPAVTSYDYDDCNELIYKMNLNSDCREFYNKAGEISYHSYSLTVTCSNDCHPFRLTKNNIVKDPVTGANISWTTCQSLSIYSDYHDVITNGEFVDRGECVLCKSGGTWDSASDSCIYRAIPSEGAVCSAAVSGCREYSGNNGNTVYNVFVTDFEGSAQGWQGIGATTVITDNDSLRVNEEALRVQVAPYTIAREVGTQVQEGKSYYLEFLAKGISAASFTSIHLTNGTEIANFRTDPSLSISLGADYTLYKLNLASLDHSVALAESMVIEADGSFMIDDIKLVEITDRYYLIENSWQIPDSCYEDIYGNPAGQLLNLGCDEYTDRAGDAFYIHNFPILCQESAVGCEELIDTHNYSDYNGMTFNSGDPSEEVVLADNIVYAVYDEKKECYEDQKGCQILGKPYDYGNISIYRATYLINDPDDYGTIHCYDNEVGCKAWTNREGNTYFKDPGDETCEYRIEANSGKTGGVCVLDTDCDSGYACESGVCLKKVRNWNWFKTAVKRCDTDANGSVGVADNICLDNSDCSLTGTTCATSADCGNPYDVCLSGVCRNSCITDKNDYPCPTTRTSTIGIGGHGAQINTPTVDVNDNNWVGICPSSEESCSEYIDPVSDFSVNLLANGSFGEPPAVTYSTDWYCSVSGAVCTSASPFLCSATDGTCTDNVWKGSGGTYTQAVSLKRNYMYRLAAVNDTAGSSITITCPSLSEFNETNNTFVSVGTSVTVNNTMVNDMNSKMFYIADGADDMKCTVVMNNVDLSLSSPDYAEVKQVVVNYQLEVGLDKKTCNGIVNRNEGCVLFNERKVKSKNLTNIVYSSLNYDADNTIYGGGPKTCSGTNCNSNQVIKVTPDRMCDKWLACTGMTEAGKTGESVCDAIGICDKLDDNGNCERFVAKIEENYVYNPVISGIVTAGDIYNMSGYVKVGYLGTMVNRDTTRKSDDKFNFGSMQPYGGQTQILNNSFEFASENFCTIDPPSPAACGNKDFAGDYEAGIDPSADWGDLDYASDWHCDPSGSSKCEVIDDPVENEKEKICFTEDRDSTCKIYAPDGRNFLKLIADNEGVAKASSSQFSVSANTDYVLSFFINTLRLSNGRAQVRVIELDRDGAQTGMWQHAINYRLDWRKEIVTLRSSASASTMLIELTAIDLPQGNVYFDKLEIRESLRSRDDIVMEDVYETKDCRLYPKDDSLSCDYYEGGIRYKGWTGYCLEYDRYPGWANACLQWWSIPSSVDSVNSWCGDNKVGDDEDCECLPIGGVEQFSCPSQLSLSGTAVSNEYYCENCMWTQGWCGDNYIDNDRYGEECDWNDSLKVGPVGTIPNTGIITAGGTNVPITCENLPYAYNSHPYLDTYRGKMFTDGNLGCFSHDGGANAEGSAAENNFKCLFDVDYTRGTDENDPNPAPTYLSDPAMANGFGCTTNLFDDDLASATNVVHNAAQCLALNSNPIVDRAVVVSESLGGIEVINEFGETVGTYTDFGNTFCKIVLNPSLHLPTHDQVCNAISPGWRNFKNWSATDLCYAYDSCDSWFSIAFGAITGGMTGAAIYEVLNDADCKVVREGHDWSSVVINSGSDHEGCSWPASDCDVSCYGVTTEVGCY